MNMFSQVVQAVRDELPEVELLSDRHSAKRYYIAKVNGKTIGYIQGQNSVRVEAREIRRRVIICHPAQIPVAVDFLRQEVAAT